MGPTPNSMLLQAIDPQATAGGLSRHFRRAYPAESKRETDNPPTTDVFQRQIASP